MCLLVVAWRCHPAYRLVVAANRDEYHARPTAPLAPWNDAAGIVAGRDLQANGTWLGVDGRARFGSVTNFREFGRRKRSAPSRGGLIPGFLSQPGTAREYLQALETDAPGYAGFNLLLADEDSLWYASNRADQFARPLSPGIYGLSNEFLDTPWPKLLRVKARLAELLQEPAQLHVLFERLFAMLADRVVADPAALPESELSPEWARKLSAPFVLDPTYGTRCSTVLVVGHDGAVTLVERRFDAHGELSGVSEHSLNAASARG